MLPDDRIGLIDFGATKRLTKTERLYACVLYAALHRQDRQVRARYVEMIVEFVQS